MMQPLTREFPLWYYSLDSVSADPDWLATFADQALIHGPQISREWLAGRIRPRRIAYHYAADGIVVVEIPTFLTKRFCGYSCYAGFPSLTDLAETIEELNREQDVRAIILAFGDVPGSTTGGIEMVETAIKNARDDLFIVSHVHRRLLGAVVGLLFSTHAAYAGPKARVGAPRCAQLATGWLTRDGTGCVDTWNPIEEANNEKLTRDYNDIVCECIEKIRPNIDREALHNNEVMNAERAHDANFIDGILTLDALVERIRCRLEFLEIK